MLALVLMVSLLTVYADLRGILGGAVISAGILDVSFAAYFSRTQTALSLTAFAPGLIKSAVYGVLVALSGCLRGIQSGRSAAAVGVAATSAVVTGLVFIIVASALEAGAGWAGGLRGVLPVRAQWRHAEARRPGPGHGPGSRHPVRR